MNHHRKSRNLKGEKFHMTISLKDYCQLMKLIKKIGNRWY
jgi:hypothetical protein